MLRKDFEEEKKKRKRKAGVALLLTGTVLLAGLIFGFCQRRSEIKNQEKETEEVTEEVTEDVDETQIPEETLQGTEDLKSDTEEVEERPTTTLWEDNGPDDRDVPEEEDAAYRQETSNTEVTVETQGGME